MNSSVLRCLLSLAALLCGCGGSGSDPTAYHSCVVALHCSSGQVCWTSSVSESQCRKPCSRDDDCPKGKGSAVCDVAGYCFLPCNRDADCPEAMICLSFTSDSRAQSQPGYCWGR